MLVSITKALMKFLSQRKFLRIYNDRFNFSKKYNNTQNKYNTYDNDYHDPKKENHKKILCHNILEYGKCNYGTKCLYAHNLDEQKIDTKRQRAINLIHSNESLDEIDLMRDKDLYKNLCVLTKMCTKCIDNKCEGGYNCKYGSCDENNLVCYDDLNYGRCENKNCSFIHLSIRGLKPYYKYIKRERTGNFIAGTKLTEEFFMHLSQHNEDNDANNDSDSDSIELNDEVDDNNDKKNDEECKESIFNFMNIINGV